MLVVDDDPELRRTLVDELEANEYPTLEAHDGTHALGYLNTPIDVLVTDIQLPGIDGIDLAARFQQEQPNTSIVFISGALSVDVRDRLPKEASVLAKPFDLPTFLATLQNTPTDNTET